jgi:hypothetical protein
LSADNVRKGEPTTDTPNLTHQLDTPQLDASELELPSDTEKIIEKLAEEKKLSAPQTIQVKAAHSDDEKFGDSRKNVTEEKMKSVTEITESNPKGGSFFKKIFKDNKDKTNSNGGKDNRNDNTETRKEPNKKENKNKDKITSKPESDRESSADNDEVVYLTDDDIDDLIK